MYNIDICTYKHINNIFMYTYRSSCPLVSETPTPPQVLWPNESENAFSKQRQRSSKIPTL